MLEGWEWLIIGIVAIVVIMWGPAKIPEFARALGRAKGEFNKAKQDFTEAATNSPLTLASASTFVSSAAPQQTTPQNRIKTSDELLVDAAQKLGLSTEGKTKEEISEEVSLKVKSLSAQP